RNLMERLVVLKEDGIIEKNDLPMKIRNTQPQGASRPDFRLSDEGICLNSAVTEFEKALILQSLEKTRWVKKKAAQLLHLNRTTLVEKIKRHQIAPQTEPVQQYATK
ncbi:MAG: sigma-54-dependent Fis family transcriptional regulator, partial [Desulfosarcina sp.]|nr:sigma-54-dependent Fis family transcriptional regulator [Desulfobacterales bacterium]